MTLVRYNPSRYFATEFDQFFADFLPSIPVNGGENASAGISPRVEIRDEAEAIHLTAEVPGVEKDRLKVEVNGRVLTLSGEKQAEQESNENGFYRSERVYGAFKRSFTLPDEVDVEKIVANSENGVLRVTLPKKPESKPKLISIGDGGSKQVDVA